MKKILLVPFMLLLTISVIACDNDSPETAEPENNGENNNNISGENGRYLVLFASRSGNTESMANEIARSLGCDILEVEPTTPYDSDYNTMLQRSQREQAAIEAGNYPAINTSVENLETYDIIFIGYPIWYGHMATPMQTFLHTHADKLKGKRIALFASSGSSGITTSVNDARTLCPDATFSEALLLTSSTLGQLSNRIADWLQQIEVTP